MKKIFCALIALLTWTLSAAQTLSVGNAEVNAGGNTTIGVSLSNSGKEVTSIQADLVLPDGLTLNGSITLTSRASSSHTLYTNVVDGATRIVVHSSQSAAFSGTSGDIITIPVKASGSIALGNYNVTLRNITIATKSGAETEISSVSGTVTVNPIAVTGITLNRTTFVMDPGDTMTLTASVSPSNATDKTVAWTSSNTSVATVDANGKVTAVAVGNATITATSGGKSATCSVTVNPVEVIYIVLNRSILNLKPGENEQLTATVYPENATDKTVTWTSSNTSIATVDANGKVTAVAVGNATITATSGGKSATCSVTVNPIAVTSVSLNKTSLSLTVGGTETLTATVSPSNATDKTVTWKSSNTSVATVDANGKVTAVAVGNATITATSGSKSATCSVSVNPIAVTSVTLNKTSLSLTVGSSETLTATVSPSNATDKTVTWKSSNTSVATVDANGKVTAVAVGNATITATSGSKSATCTVTVNPIEVSSVALNKTTLSLLPGSSETLTATVLPSNATDKTVTWKSSNTSVATVDANGKVTAVAVGNATITATSGSKSATCTVTVNPIEAESVTLNMTKLNIIIGSTEILTATVLPANTTNKTVTWTSSNPSVATVDAYGKVTAVAVGSAAITATCGSKSATCDVTVSPIVSEGVVLNKTTLSLLIGSSESLIATVLPENATDKTITWKSSNTSVATVDANGKVTAVALGNATITATCGAKSATCEVTVNPIVATGVTLNKTTLSLLIGSSETLTATVMPANTTDKTVTWTSSNTSVATVDANGKVTAVALGNATITATCGSKSATCEVTVNPIVATGVTLNKTTLSLLIGSSETLTATVMPANTTDKTVTWTSSNTSIATVDVNGKVTAVALGNATITATCGAKSATCEVTVNPIVATGVTLNKTTLSLLIGSSETLTATVMPANTTDKTVTWTSSNTSVATVDANGKVTAVALGNATITATCGAKSATCEVTVNPIVATGVTLNKTTLSLLIGSSETLNATVLPENTTDKTVTWTSSNTSVATVDVYGKVTAVAVGDATITATCGDKSATCAVTVNPIVAESVSLNMQVLNLLIGSSETLSATVLPANTTDKTVTWTSSDTSVATVDANGKVTAVGLGSATITATCGDKSATCTVTVNPIVSEGVVLNKTTLNLLVGASETLTATVLPETTTDKTITWSTSDASVATVDANGKVTAVAVGTATITATCGDKSSTCAVNVNPVEATAIAINKSSVTLLLGATQTLTATVQPDNTTDKTISWSTSDASIATVDANGTVTAIAVGSASIIATCGSVSATCVVNVNPIVATNVVLNKTSLNLLIGSSETLTATVLPENTTDKTVTWTTSDATIATVDVNGQVTAVALGHATITATCGTATASCVINVNPIEPTAVTLNKSTMSMLLGSSETLTATITPVNTTVKTVTWTTSDASVATVDANGQVTAVGLGTATITATCGAKTATCAVTVNPIEATGVTLNKTSLNLLLGSSETLTASVMPENTTDKTVTWTSSNTSVATVDANGKVTAVALGNVTITATCGAKSATCEVTVNPIVAESITLNMTMLNMTIGSTESLTATVLPANTTVKTVTWSTTDATVASVDANGKVTALAVGKAVITATCGSVSASCAVTVNPIVSEGVVLNKTTLNLLVGSSETLTASVLPESTTDKTITWSTSDASIATVDANGKVTAIAVGTATITATCGSKSATCAVNVNPIVASAVTLNKTSLTLLLGSTETLTATVQPANTTDQTVTWLTSDASIATVDANGKVTGVAVGKATITATCGEKSASCAVTVNPIDVAAVTLNKTSLNMLIGSSETLTATVEPSNATNKSVTWQSSNSAVATVDANGKVTAIAVGSATITATCGTKSATCAVTVNPIEATGITLNKTSLTLLVGSSETLSATVEPSNATNKTVTWRSSNTSVATVDANGKVTAVSVGKATITATCGSKSATCAVTVNPIEATGITLNKTSLSMLLGSSELLTATVQPSNTTDKTVTWKSSNPSVATVDVNGKVTAIAVGNATITATCGSKFATCAVTVNPIVATSVTLNMTMLNLVVGSADMLTATVLPSNTTDKTITWSTSDASVATVDANGMVRAISVGSAIITATCGMSSATCTVTVSPVVSEGVVLNKTTLSLLIGSSETLIATVLPESTTDKHITWTTSNESVATVDANGKVTAVAVGTAIISATCGSQSANCVVNVNPIVAESISLNETQITIKAGNTYNLKVTIEPANTTNRYVTWSSDDESVATVDVLGCVTAVGAGQCVIRATNKASELYAECTVTVYSKKFVLIDGTNYDNTIDCYDVDVEYTRTFDNTCWQALYLPFNMSYAEWSEYAEIARIDNVSDYDIDEDGVIDSVHLEFSRINSGDLVQNTPYIIKAKETGTYTFVGSGKTLLAVPAADSSVIFTSNAFTYDLRGIYERKYDLAQTGLYYLSGGAFIHTSDYTESLPPYRFYLMVTPNGATVEGLPGQIAIYVDNVEESGIADALMDMPHDDCYYDMLGRKVQHPVQGFYIRNGQKVMVK